VLQNSGAPNVKSLFAGGDEKALREFLQLSGTIKLKGGPVVDSDMSVEKLQSIKEARLDKLTPSEAAELLKLMKTQFPAPSISKEQNAAQFSRSLNGSGLSPIT